MKEVLYLYLIGLHYGRPGRQEVARCHLREGVRSNRSRLLCLGEAVRAFPRTGLASARLKQRASLRTTVERMHALPFDLCQYLLTKNISDVGFSFRFLPRGAFAGVRVGVAWYLRSNGGVWAGNAWYLRSRVAGPVAGLYGGRAFAEGSHGYLRGVYGRVFAEASRGVRVGVVWYLWYNGRCMGRECVVFAGWPAYGGRAFAEGSRGHRICGVRAAYGRGMRGPAYGGRAYRPLCVNDAESVSKSCARHPT